MWVPFYHGILGAILADLAKKFKRVKIGHLVVSAAYIIWSYVFTTTRCIGK